MDDGVDGELELSPDEEGDGCRRKTSPMIPALFPTEFDVGGWMDGWELRGCCSCRNVEVDRRR